MLERFLNRRQPVYGSIISTGLYDGLGEFSGIFAGNHQVLTLAQKARRPQLITLEEFSKLPPANAESEIYVSFEAGTWKAASFPQAVRRARELYDGTGDYRLLLMNSHQFCSGCLTGNFDNMDTGLAELKQTISEICAQKLEWHKQN